MSSSSSTTYSLITIFHGLWVIKHSKTPITEPSPHCDSTTLSNLHHLRVCTRSCHSQLIDYIIIVRLTAWPFYLCPSSLGHNPDSALSLHQTFTIILFVLRDNSKFWDDILSTVIIAFCFTIPLAWCRRRAIASSWSLSTKFVVIIINILTPSRISIKFMMGNTILAPRWSCYHRPHPCLPSTQTCSCFGLNLEFLAIQHLFFFTLEYYHLLCQEGCENCPAS